jgi:hypothetical protein
MWRGRPTSRLRHQGLIHLSGSLTLTLSPQRHQVSYSISCPSVIMRLTRPIYNIIQRQWPEFLVIGCGKNAYCVPPLSPPPSLPTTLLMVSLSQPHILHHSIKCRNVNFPRRSQCNRCASPRPLAGYGGEMSPYVSSPVHAIAPAVSDYDMALLMNSNWQSRVSLATNQFLGE